MSFFNRYYKSGKLIIYPFCVLDIYDLFRMVIAKAQLENGIVKVSSLKPGIYLIVVETDSDIYSGKFVKF